MKLWIAFWNILLKDMRVYYLKPPERQLGADFSPGVDGHVFHQVR
jgi:ABC-2 type transport system permease protein